MGIITSNCLLFHFSDYNVNVNQTIPSLLDLVKNNFALRARSLLSRRPWSSEIILCIVAGYHVDLGFLRKLIIRNQC